MMKKKLYLIVLTNLKFETLAIFNIKFMAKLDSMSY